MPLTALLVMTSPVTLFLAARGNPYCITLWVSLDQTWQAGLHPILNWLLKPDKMKFGNPDFTASKVIGNNLGQRHFRRIDAVLSFFDPRKGSHSKHAAESNI